MRGGNATGAGSQAQAGGATKPGQHRTGATDACGPSKGKADGAGGSSGIATQGSPRLERSHSGSAVRREQRGTGWRRWERGVPEDCTRRRSGQREAVRRGGPTPDAAVGWAEPSYGPVSGKAAGDSSRCWCSGDGADGRGDPSAGCGSGAGGGGRRRAAAASAAGSRVGGLRGATALAEARSSARRWGHGWAEKPARRGRLGGWASWNHRSGTKAEHAATGGSRDGREELEPEPAPRAELDEEQPVVGRQPARGSAGTQARGAAGKPEATLLSEARAGKGCHGHGRQ